MTQNHTPTPWQIIENMAPYNARIDIYPTNAKEGTPLNDIRICRIKLKPAPVNGEIQAVGAMNDAIRKAEADAEFIVRACNAHDDLVAALKVAKTRLQNCYNTFSHPGFTDRYGDASNTKVALDIVEAALAKVKEGA